MTAVLPEDPVAREVFRQELRNLYEVDLCKSHPAYLAHFVTCVDTRTGDTFDFQTLTPEECDRHGLLFKGDGWHWQRELLDWWLENDQSVALKGRQLGVTWAAGLLALWHLLYKAGTDVLVYSIKEDDAVEVIQRIWGMFQSLPPHLRNGVRVLKPSRGLPTTEIIVEHPDGRISTITGMASTKSAGHGRTAALVIFDEASRQEYAREAWKAVVPASADKGGRILVISTANGMSGGDGDGNFFHHLWSKAGGADYPRLAKKFLGWWLHPDRDEHWYETVGLNSDDRAEQYPNDPEEAFLMSGSPWFELEHIKWYAANGVREPLYRCVWESDPKDPRKATLTKGDDLPILVFKEPDPSHKYAIAVDSATGGGTDYTVAVVIDLMTAEIAAEAQAKWDEDIASEQLHFLGAWYGTSDKKALIAVENQGGYGTPIIVGLRDGKHGRPRYARLYRHRGLTRTEQATTSEYGFPMSVKTRPQVLSQLREWVRDHELPWMSDGMLSECRTFVRADTKPSPRAADGCNDDRVMAYAIALELFRQFGEMPKDIRRKARAEKKKQPKRTVDPFGGPKFKSRKKTKT